MTTDKWINKACCKKPRYHGDVLVRPLVPGIASNGYRAHFAPGMVDAPHGSNREGRSAATLQANVRWLLDPVFSIAVGKVAISKLRRAAVAHRKMERADAKSWREKTGSRRSLYFRGTKYAFIDDRGELLHEGGAFEPIRIGDPSRWACGLRAGVDVDYLADALSMPRPIRIDVHPDLSGFTVHGAFGHLAHIMPIRLGDQ